MLLYSWVFKIFTAHTVGDCKILYEIEKRKVLKKKKMFTMTITLLL